MSKCKNNLTISIVALLSIILLITIPESSLGQESKKSKWIYIDTTLAFTTDVPISTAREKTLNAARQGAVKKAIPAEVLIASALNDRIFEKGNDVEEQTAYSIFSILSTTGHIIDEEILYSKVEKLEKNIYHYRVKLKASVAEPSGERNPALSLEVGLNKNFLKDGDELQITVKSSADGYIYLFNFLPDNSVVLIFPNALCQNNFIKSNTIFEIPSKKEKERGIKYRVRCHPESEMTVETILAVFCINPIAGIDKFVRVKEGTVTFSAGDESFVQFQKWLAEVPLSQRVEKAVQIHIYR